LLKHVGVIIREAYTPKDFISPRFQIYLSGPKGEICIPHPKDSYGYGSAEARTRATEIANVLECGVEFDGKG
jgi:hypothetical protein